MPGPHDSRLPAQRSGIRSTVLGPTTFTPTAGSEEKPIVDAAAVSGEYDTTYLHGDQIGSTRLLTAGEGWPMSSDTFYPFGQEPAGASSPNHYQYASLERDPETGLDHATFRQYSPTTGRWMSPDPYDGSYDYTNPQSLNRYAYVGNNPLSFTDPSGLRKAQSCDDTDSCPGGGGGLAILTGGYVYGASWNEFTTLYNVFKSWTTPGGALTASFYNIPIPHDGLDLVNIGYSAGRTFGADGGEIDTATPPACQANILSATNNQFGTNYTDGSVHNAFNKSIGAPAGQGTLNLDIYGSTAGVSTGYYPVHWWTYAIGYGATLHVVSGPGGHAGLDSQDTLQFGPNQATFHIDSGYVYNPIGAVVHLLLNFTPLGGYPPC